MKTAPRIPGPRRALPRSGPFRSVGRRPRGIANAPARPPACPSAARAGAAQLALGYGAPPTPRTPRTPPTTPTPEALVARMPFAARATRGSDGQRSADGATRVSGTRDPYPLAATTQTRAAEPALAGQSDWGGLWEGAREVVLTLAATLAIGFSWAAFEAGRLNDELARDSGARPANAPASGYAAAAQDGPMR